MELHKKIKLKATYKGVVPVVPNEYGNHKYIGYDHLFEKVEGKGLWYSKSRAASIPFELKPNRRYLITCNWRSSIITRITQAVPIK